LLSEQQVAYFRIFGYLPLRGLFSDCIAAISAAFDAVFADPEHLRMDTNEGTYVVGARDVIPAVVEKHADLVRLKDDPRVVDIAQSLLPGGFEFLPGDGSRFQSETTWHNDFSPKGSYIKLAMYLEPLDGSNGALRVMPGTQIRNQQYTDEVRAALLGKFNKVEETLGIPGTDVPCQVLDTTPGDMFVWDRRILHASYGGAGIRRVLSFGFKGVDRSNVAELQRRK